MPLAIATTILNPASNFVVWLDYHLQRCDLVLLYLDDPIKRPLFQQLCSNRAVRLLAGSTDAPSMARSSRLLLRQGNNLKHAIALLLDMEQQQQGRQRQRQRLRERGVDEDAGRGSRAADANGKLPQDSYDDWWLLHIDQDEILYDNGGDTTWRTQPDMGHVTFLNHEAIPISHDTQDAFRDCVWFTLNRDDVLFMAYGKS
ncbi:MAG: hypothetical protein M1820_000477 [Bogoriella megaspora]|nr:MAG: hypothetical protein M1820_000477 [Bogoriella megaspora]